MRGVAAAALGAGVGAAVFTTWSVISTSGSILIGTVALMGAAGCSFTGIEGAGVELGDSVFTVVVVVVAGVTAGGFLDSTGGDGLALGL